LTGISDASYSILAEYEDFANFGEDLGETLITYQGGGGYGDYQRLPAAEAGRGI
jgi:hypothetical protein